MIENIPQHVIDEANRNGLYVKALGDQIEVGLLKNNRGEIDYVRFSTAEGVDNYLVGWNRGVRWAREHRQRTDTGS